jgi:hypothetical protein
VLVGYFVYYTLQYNGIPSFLHVTTLLPVYSNPDLLHHKIISSTMLLLILTFSSTASLQSSGLSHTTCFNPFSTSGFIALLLVLHYLLLWHQLLHLYPPVIRILTNDCFLIAPLLRSYYLTSLVHFDSKGFVLLRKEL